MSCGIFVDGTATSLSCLRSSFLPTMQLQAVNPAQIRDWKGGKSIKLLCTLDDNCVTITMPNKGQWWSCIGCSIVVDKTINVKRSSWCTSQPSEFGFKNWNHTHTLSFLSVFSTAGCWQVRVCDACYDKVSRPPPSSSKLEIVDTASDYGPNVQPQVSFNTFFIVA